MEKRSHRRICDLDVLTAFRGLVANEIGCARISMMARKQNAPFNGPNTDARDQSSPNCHYPACTARPVHTKYMVKGPGQPGQSWTTFLRNEAMGIAAADLFVVPTIGFKLLYCLVLLAHGRRELVHHAVAAHPTAEWVAHQMTEAFPWDTAPRYLVRDRDAVYGHVVTRRLRALGIRDRPTAQRSPWQNAYVERFIGSVRRECTDHVIVRGESHLRRIVSLYASYFNEARTHLSLAKDPPIRRPIEPLGCVIAESRVGGLHHRYARI